MATPLSINPQTAALLVMDMQPIALSRLPKENQTLLPAVVSAIAKARNAGIKVIYIRMAFSDTDFTDLPSTNMGLSPIASNPEFRTAVHITSPTSAIHQAVAPQPDDLVVRKMRFGPFAKTDIDLNDYLKEHGIETLILAGIATSGVVLSAVRYAADLDYRVVVLEDATADRDPEVQRVLIEKVIPRQAHVVMTEQLEGVLERK